MKNPAVGNRRVSPIMDTVYSVFGHITTRNCSGQELTRTNRSIQMSSDAQSATFAEILTAVNVLNVRIFIRSRAKFYKRKSSKTGMVRNDQTPSLYHYFLQLFRRDPYVFIHGFWSMVVLFEKAKWTKMGCSWTVTIFLTNLIPAISPADPRQDHMLFALHRKRV